MSGDMPPDTLAGDLSGCLSAQFRVWPDVVLVVPPGAEHEPGVGQRGEQRLVEAFVTQATVEALDEAVLHRLARRDVMPFDPPLPRPAQDIRTDDAPPPTRVTAAAIGRRLAATVDTGLPDGSRQPACTPDARSARDAHGHGQRLSA